VPQVHINRAESNRHQHQWKCRQHESRKADGLVRTPGKTGNAGTVTALPGPGGYGFNFPRLLRRVFPAQCRYRHLRPVADRFRDLYCQDSDSWY
jgi:hypothetical protein